MKYIVGYNQNSQNFSDEIIRHSSSVAEVYFPWVNTPSGRSSLNITKGAVNWESQHTLEDDLKRFDQANIELDLILNANCFGAQASSAFLQNNVCSIIDHINTNIARLKTVTTASLAVAHVIKKHFNGIKVRASINMNIGTSYGMEQVSHLFDSYYVQKDHNRDFERLIRLRNWADKNNKELILLANSGCLRNCPGQIFHDNLVAHLSEVEALKPIPEFDPVLCENLITDKNNWVRMLHATWIRPEDTHKYSRYFDKIKLATRSSSFPEKILSAYANEKYYGNLLDILEPGHGKKIFPWYIDNTLFPSDWFDTTANCDKNCEACNYCNNVLDITLKKLG